MEGELGGGETKVALRYILKGGGGARTILEIEKNTLI